MPSRRVLFDFDGTLVRDNSFPHWVAFLVASGLIRGEPILSLRVATLVVRRKVLRRLTHEQFKASLIGLNVPATWDRRFLDKALARSNVAVFAKLRQHLLSGDTVWVSSAAPIRYLRGLKERLPAGDLRVLGAVVVDGKLVDNSRELKAANLFSSGVFRDGAELDIVYTDSSDDIFCARRSLATVLVNPSDASYRAYMSDPELYGRVSVLDLKEG